MSVILEALQKARSDRKSKAASAEGAARILEPHSSGPVLVTSQERSNPANGGVGRSWVLAVAVIMSLVLLLCLIGGMFWLLYDQVRRVNTAVPAPPATTVVAPPVVGPTGALPGGAPLPTPLPVQELPVQPPNTMVEAPGTLPESSTDVKAVAPAPDFVLGSIVCEAGDCLASLNGRSVRVGDNVKGWTVIQIDTSTLVLQNASGEKRSLSLFD